MIHICISISEKINDLSLKDAFIYTWLIPHLDDYGRMSGSPRTIKALVFPLKKEITIEDIEEALKKFKGLKLFFWEKVENEFVLQQPIEEFNLYQTIYYRKKSKFSEILRNSKKLLEIKINSKKLLSNRIEVNRIEENRREVDSKNLLENQENPTSIKEIIERLK
jgi:hypothetical protein